ncbi:hypothetical protein RJ639_018924 [Escallonia herrerae]|uniref:Cyclic nucleotide-binding domain-containing protein n=1 Tax=Escallonia herrerae TaxID=1293975 RepID=A0AA88V8B3_9ASTE|nr:hypothetical protein RJ639_018924 [Escallonia herrerae]
MAENSWGYLLLLYVYVQVSRVVVVGILFPFLRYFGYGLDWKEAAILVWSGLRGAVALSLSLSVQRSSGSSYISSETGTLFVFLTGGIVFLTLIVNGSTTQLVLHMLDMDKLSSAKRRILEYTKYEMLSKALEAFGDLGEDEELGPADWNTVKRYIACLNDIEGERLHPHTVSGSDNNLDPMNLKDIRIRFLNGVQAAYWGMLDEGRITQTTANILMQSVDEALDSVSHQPLCDWNGLKDNVHFPNYYKLLQTSIFPRKLVSYFTVQRLESACYICAAFLRAHRAAQRQLHDFIGDSEVASIIINESEVQGVEAKKFLEDVRVTFPQVLRVVKTRQVTYSVLNHLIDYVQNLEKVGLLEEKEMVHLHDAVQTDLKKLLRNPPIVKIPKIRDLISVNPLLGALPSAVREPLVGSTKETMKLRGVTLYREGSKPNGIWLISNGVVKWEMKCTQNRHSLHPTFTHGSTLGLYEVLTGKPYVCDIITDSVVLCFFVEAEKILAVLRSDPAVEDFLWQESVIILVKLMLPQFFEKMAMQDLRVLVTERSTMSTYLRGETFELPHHFIGFLLEGFIRTQGIQEEMVTSPAALLPGYGDLSFLGSETSGEHHEDPKEHDEPANNLSARVMQLSMFGSMISKPRWCGRSYSSIQVKPSYPGVPTDHGRPLVSVRSEGSSTVRRNGELKREPSNPSVPSSSTKDNRVKDCSSDESDAEDEHIVRIDSPSTLNTNALKESNMFVVDSEQIEMLKSAKPISSTFLLSNEQPCECRILSDMTQSEAEGIGDKVRNEGTNCVSLTVGWPPKSPSSRMRRQSGRDCHGVIFKSREFQGKMNPVILPSHGSYRAHGQVLFTWYLCAHFSVHLLDFLTTYKPWPISIVGYR